MDMIVKIIKKPSLVSVLLLIAFSAMVFSGCGKSGTPPPGATLTLAKSGNLKHSNQGSTDDIATQMYRVTVIDTDGIPLQGVEVDIQGSFTSGDNITFPASVKTGDFGFFDFPISAPTYSIRTLADVVVGATPAATGGSLVDGTTYTYSVTAVDGFGQETNATPSTISAIVSTPSCTITHCGNVTITWTPVTGAAGYNVYGRIAGSEGLMTATKLPNTTLTFLDNGSIPPSVIIFPPTSNTTGVALNPVVGTLTATAGALLTTLDIAQ